MNKSAKPVEVGFGSGAEVVTGPGVLGTRVKPRLRSMPDQIAERIYDDIVAGTYAPGERIREEELAELFGVSRGPIREALRILEKDSVVRLFPNRGASVTELSLKEVNDIFLIRQLLAGATIRALEGRGPTFMQQFDERVAALEALAASPDSHSAYVAASVALTLDLANASGNERLAQIMLSLARQSSRYTQVALSRPQRRKESARNWRSVVKALAANRTIEASLAMEKLVDDARREAVKTLESGETASKRSTT